MRMGIRSGEERFHERRSRMGEEIGGSADLFEVTVAQYGDAVGEVEGFLLVVRNQDRRDVELVVECGEPAAELMAHLGVEGAERLVEEEHRRARGEGAGQRNPLGLAARDLRNAARGEAVELHQGEELVDPVGDLGAGAVADAERERDVLKHIQVLKERVLLEDDAKAALACGEVGDVVGAQVDAAGIGVVEARDEAEQGRLAGA
jgi:hypothetical protein